MCVFSSCHDYVAVISTSPYKQPQILQVYHIFVDDGQIAKLDLSVAHLETLTRLKIDRMRIDFHPSQTKLGVAYWVKGAANQLYLKFLMLDLRSLDLEHVQPSFDERIPLVGRSTMIASSIHEEILTVFTL